MSELSSNIVVEQMSEREQKQANEVLEILDRWSARFEGHQTEKREDTRSRFRGPITIHVSPENSDLSSEIKDDFQVKARNLSTRGLSFVHKEKLEEKNIVICLDRDSKNPLCMNAEIVRLREVHNGFWEHGVTFRGRANA